MKISVVIPLYNKGEYIGRAVESVLKQTVQPDDFVIVDDGSTDGSANEVLKFGDSRIRLIRQENAGVSIARNRGVSESHCDLVAFLDADDEWKPDFLLHIRRLYRNFPDCGAYATAYESIDADGSISKPFLGEIPPAPWIGIIPNYFRLVQLGDPFFSSSIAIPKGVFNELKGFPEGIHQGEDRMLWIRLGARYPIAFSPSRQCVYHRGINSRFLERDSVVADLVDEMLKSHDVSIESRQDLENYGAYLKLQRAYHLVISNRSKDASELLSLIAPNRKYCKQILYWRFWSRMPWGLTNLARKIRKIGRKN